MRVCKNCFYWHKSGLCLLHLYPTGFTYECDDFFTNNSDLYLPARKELQRKFVEGTIKKIIQNWLKNGFALGITVNKKIKVEELLRLLNFLLEEKVGKRKILKAIVALEYSDSKPIIRKGKFFYF